MRSLRLIALAKPQCRRASRMATTTTATSTPIHTTTQIHSGPTIVPLLLVLAACERDVATPAMEWPGLGPGGPHRGWACLVARVLATRAAARSFVLAALRALHLAPAPGSPALRGGVQAGQQPGGPAMRAHVQGTVYLLHFTEPYRHARHYMGSPRVQDYGRRLGGSAAVSWPDSRNERGSWVGSACGEGPQQVQVGRYRQPVGKQEGGQKQPTARQQHRRLLLVAGRKRPDAR
jgi:hypothetical protein